MKFRPVAITRLLASLLVPVILIAASPARAAALNDDSAKLEALKKAMTEAEEGGEVKKKRRTRAIVFDNDAQESAAPAKSAGPRDCASLPADVRANAVDFAIQFKVGSAEVSPASVATLTEIGKILSLSPDRCVLVEGHTDASGNADKNLALSRERANSVVRFITEKVGLERKRFVPVGKGSSDTLKDVDSHDPKNRRVVFKVVSD